jgi:hypothetical protein
MPTSKNDDGGTSSSLSPNRELTVGAKILCSWRLGWGGDASLFMRTSPVKEGRVRMNLARISCQQPTGNHARNKGG